MKTVTIIDADKLMATQLKLFLKDKFERLITVQTFYSAQDGLNNLGDFVIVGDTEMKHVDLVKRIMEYSPQINIIVLSNNEYIAVAIQTFRAGAKDYVVKGDGSWKKISRSVNKFICNPKRN